MHLGRLSDIMDHGGGSTSRVAGSGPALQLRAAALLDRVRAGRVPAPWPPARWTSPAAPATARATAPARGASGRGTSARAPPPHLPATGSVPPRGHCLRLLPSSVPVSSALPFQPIALRLRVPPWLHFRIRERRA